MGKQWGNVMLETQYLEHALIVWTHLLEFLRQNSLSILFPNPSPSILGPILCLSNFFAVCVDSREEFLPSQKEALT